MVNISGGMCMFFWGGAVGINFVANNGGIKKVYGAVNNRRRDITLLIMLPQSMN